MDKVPSTISTMHTQSFTIIGVRCLNQTTDVNILEQVRATSIGARLVRNLLCVGLGWSSACQKADYQKQPPYAQLATSKRVTGRDPSAGSEWSIIIFRTRTVIEIDTNVRHLRKNRECRAQLHTRTTLR